MDKPTLLYLSRADVEAMRLPMRRVIDAVESALREKGEGTVEMPPKPGIHPGRDAFIHAMPALLRGMGAGGLKWVSGFPANKDRGLPYIAGLFVLNDMETGLPLAVMDCTWITGARTGAATAVAAWYLARPESATAGILGCGIQGRTNLEALAAVFPVKRAHAFDIHPERAQAYAREMSGKLGVEVVAVDSPEAAVRGMDLVVTAGPILKDPSPTIPAGWLEPGAFACPLDFDSYWTKESMAEVDRFATDDRDQLAYYRAVGYFRETPDPYADLGELVVGRKEGRRSDSERTMSMNLGLAIEDVAVARMLYELALEKGAGTRLPL